MHSKLAQKNFSTMAKTNSMPNFEYGMIWEDPVSGHCVGCLDVSKKEDVEKFMKGKKTALAIQDPPYNVDINVESIMRSFSSRIPASLARMTR